MTWSGASHEPQEPDDEGEKEAAKSHQRRRIPPLGGKYSSYSPFWMYLVIAIILIVVIISIIKR